MNTIASPPPTPPAAPATTVKPVPISLPDENELVIAIIKKIMPYGAFCTLPEYGNLEAFLHVSEVAPRWIKNIHEFISEGQQHVVKVHHVDREKNQVDVSIKRVNEEEKKLKLEFVQNEKRGKKLFELAVKESGLKLDPKWQSSIEAEYGDVYSFFKDLSAKGEKSAEKLGLPAKFVAAALELAKKSIKKASVTIESSITITCYGPKGIDEIKNALSIEGVSIHYLGAPRYKLSLTAPDYKSGEKKMNQIVQKIQDSLDSKTCDFTSDREK
ncbi:S1 RNA-binding domain-containing protein [Candidatus Micrarchaeota archaeon]|nr:S1 RNA-binding domain-containing protein [Candidatus Micrarchaeota archaeon]